MIAGIYLATGYKTWKQTVYTPFMNWLENTKKLTHTFIGTEMTITPKDWLYFVSLAYKHYEHQSPEVKQFVTWLYKQYGIVEPQDGN
jgi:hypothetical protein